MQLARGKQSDRGQVCSASRTTGTFPTCSRTRSRTRGPQTYRVRSTLIVAVKGTARMGPSRPPINNPQTKIETMTVIGCSPTDFPRIVGKSVGLHPMTVIVSIFVWGLLIGGLLGPILAVPFTATINVLLTRYV